MKKRGKEGIFLSLLLEDRHCTLSYSRTETPVQSAYYRHSHLSYELLYFVEGDAHYHVEGKEFLLHPGDLVFIPPKNYHFLQLRSSAPYERYCVNFDAAILPAESHERLALLPTVRNLAGDEAVASCFFRLSDYAARFSEADARLMLRCILREMLLNLLYAAPPEEGGRIRHHPIIDRIIALTDAEPERDWTAASLAEALYLSPSYVQNTFSRYMGIGLKTYINHKRVLYAQSLLLAGDRPAEVCEACGFRDYSTFYRLFRSVTGMAPSAVAREG